MSRVDLAPQKLRERATALRHQFAKSWRDKDPELIRREMRAAMRLLLDAQSLVDKRYPNARYYLDEANRQADRAKDMIMADAGLPRAYGSSMAAGHLVRAVERIPLRPAFRVGDATIRGRVTHIGEYSPSNGWLYRVTNERGVRDEVWESTLVWPALHGQKGRLRGAARRRAYGARDTDREERLLQRLQRGPLPDRALSSEERRELIALMHRGTVHRRVVNGRWETSLARRRDRDRG